MGLRIVVALACEAAPLIARYGLQRHSCASGSFTCYQDAERDYWLIVSGVGQVAATTATAYLAGLSRAPKSAAWLNVGIAGAADGHPLGSLWVAHKITSATTSHYPALLSSEVPSANLRTVSEPAAAPTTGLVDMEAAAFYAAASSFASHQTVQCLKVVSDHGASNKEVLSKAEIQSLIEAQHQGIMAFAKVLEAESERLRERWADPPGYAELCAKHRFTVSQAQQLRLALQRWQALLPGQEATSILANSAAPLKDLEAHLDTMRLRPTVS